MASGGAACDAESSEKERKVDEATIEFFELFQGSELFDKVEALINDPRFSRVSDIGQAGYSLVEQVALSVFAKHGLTSQDWKAVKMSKKYGSDYQILCENGPVTQVKRKKEELLKLQAFRASSHDVSALLRKEEHLNWLVSSHALREATQCLRYFVKVVAINLHKSVVDEMESKNPAWKQSNKLSPAKYDESLPEHKLWMDDILAHHTLDATNRRVTYSNCRANMLSESPLDMIKLFCSSVGHGTRDFEKFEGTVIFNIMTFCKEFHDLGVCIEDVGKRQKLVELLGPDSLTDICQKCTMFRNKFAHDYTIDQEIPTVAFNEHMKVMKTVCNYAVAVVQGMPSKCFMFGDPKFKEETLLGMRGSLTRLAELEDKVSFRTKLTPQEYTDLRERSILEADAMRRQLENLQNENLLLLCKLDEKERKLRAQFLRLSRAKEKDLMLPPGHQTPMVGGAGSVITVYWNNFECAFKRYLPEAVESWKTEIPTLLEFINHPGIVRIHSIVVSESSCGHAVSGRTHQSGLDLQQVSEPFVPIGYLMEKLHTSLGSVTCAALTRSKILQLMIQAGNTVAHLHKMHCIHGDIKPENILVTKDFTTAKLCDFGTASLRHPFSPLSHSAGKSSAALRGTWFYIAPEHLEDYEVMDERCDIYSFGMTLWQVFHPLVLKDKIGFDYNFMKLMKQIQSDFRPKLDDGLPSCLARLIQNCWQTKPDHRPQRMSEVVDILKGICFDQDSEVFISFEDSSSAGDDESTESPAVSPHASGVFSNISIESCVANGSLKASTVDESSFVYSSPSAVYSRQGSLRSDSPNSPNQTTLKQNVSAVSGSLTSRGAEEFPELLPKKDVSSVSGSFASRGAEEFPELPKAAGHAPSGPKLRGWGTEGSPAIPLMRAQPSVVSSCYQRFMTMSGQPAFKAAFPVIIQFIATQHKHRPDEIETEYVEWTKNNMQFPWWMAAYFKTCKKMSQKFPIGVLSWPCYRWNHPAGYGCKNRSSRQNDLPGCRSLSDTQYHHYCAICGFRGPNNPEPVHVNHGAFTGGSSYKCPMQKRYLEEITTFPFSEEEISEIVAGFQILKYKRSVVKEFSYKSGLYQPRKYHDYWSHQVIQEDRIERLREEETSESVNSWLRSTPHGK